MDNEHTALRRRRGVVDGTQPGPDWDGGEPLGPGIDELDTAGLYVTEEVIRHPEQVPLVCVYQMDEDGMVLGEVWVTPAALPPLARTLSELARRNYAPGARSWQEEGRLSLDFGLPADGD